MNQKLQNILNIIQQSEKLDAEQKDNLIKALKDADKELEITAFKLERTEKVKKTTAILLEETIEELEQKRKSVEAQNQELEIEASLERVRSVAMGMNKSDDLLSICEVSFKEFKKLGFDNIRNALIHIQYDEQKYFMDYDFSDLTGGAITKIEYGSHPVVEDYLKQIRSAKDAFYQGIIKEDQLEEWKDFRRNSGQIDDPRLDNATALYYYFFSIGMGDIGISTLQSIDESQIKILKRFRNVFDLAYRRYTDITKAEAQAREAQIEAALERVRSRTMGMQKSEELLDTGELLYKELFNLGIPNLICGYVLMDEEKKVGWNYGVNPADGTIKPQPTGIPQAGTKILQSITESWKKQEPSLLFELNEEETIEHQSYIAKNSVNFPISTEKLLSISPKRLVIHTFNFKHGYLLIVGGVVLDAKQQEMVIRFTKVFEQTYTRFLDLQKAEAQARKAQIETSLERVRASSMAMHKSDELLDVISVVSNQLESLGFRFDIVSFAVNNQEFDYNFWLTVKGQKHPYRIYVPYIDNPMFENVKQAQLNGKTFYSDILSREENKRWHQHLFKHNELNFVTDELKEYVFNSGYARSIALLPNILLMVGNYSSQPYSEEENDIIQRFANVFDQAYRRFLDLQKAEAQAREAEIEAALERVRSRTMAMQKSDELAETASHFFEQLNSLGIKSYRFNIAIVDTELEKCRLWSTTNEGKVIPTGPFVPLTENNVFNQMYEGWKLQQNVLVIKLQGEERINWTKYIMNFVSFSEYKPENIDLERLRHEPAIFSNFFFKQGFVVVHTIKEINETDLKIIRRFVNVFEQTYTRFLDLQKAEAQAREAQIEAALERVRSRSMAMHHTSELQDVVNTVAQQLQLMDMDINGGVFITINEDVEKELCFWGSFGVASSYVQKTFIPFLDHPIYMGLLDGIKNRREFFVEEFSNKEKIEFFKYLFKHEPFSSASEERKKQLLSREGGYTRSVAVSHYTSIFIINHNGNKFSYADNEILKRFGKVFEQTYTRFLDLQKAEAQAREAKIEASLERVRSKAMAMHSPNDLSETVNVFFKELKALGIIPIRCGVGQIDEATRTTSLTTTTSSQQGDSFQVIGKVKQTGHPVLDGIFDNWKLQKEYFPVLEGEDIKAYYDVMNPQIGYPDYPEGMTQYGNNFPFKEGFVFAWTESILSEEELQIFRRFTSVLSLTYRRYIDLKAAEVRAFEAVKQASLDRVRAQIASMRTSEDLNHITPIIWRELKNLEVPFFRCGVYIIYEKTESVHVYLTTPDGKSLGVLDLSFDSSKVTSDTVEHWRKKQVYRQHWNKEEFINWTKSLIEIGQVQNAETYQGSSEPPESLDLHFVPFAQGMLYVGDVNPLTDEKLELVKTLAEAFSIAYARYEDFQKLEAAKVEVESAFGELDVLSKELKIKNEALENENRRKALELEEARQLQLAMLPKSIPELPHLDIAVYMKTATEVGGDYYDFNVDDADGTLTVAIGDATGHGMKAGTIVSMIKALFASTGLRSDLKTYFHQSSDALKGIELGRLMMAFMMLRINSNKLEFSNAGMPPLFIYRKKFKEVEEIMIAGMPLGAMKDFPYEIRETEISAGDTLLLLSDGLPELKNEKDEQYGYTKVKDEFKSAAEKSPDEIVEYLKASASEWINGIEPDDDVTFVVIKVK